MQACLQRNDFQNVIFNKGCIFKTKFENESQLLFHKAFFSEFKKGLFFKPRFYIDYASKASLLNYKVSFKNHDLN
jgi:hypothetical protein